MTREQAIKIFNTVLLFGKCDCPKEEIEESFKMAIKALEQEPTKNDLGVEEVTALAEWIEKLTKECEEAYNKGYADGVKSVNICPHCGEYIGEEE